MKVIKWFLLVIGVMLLVEGVVMIELANFTVGNIFVISVGMLLVVWGWKFEKIRELTRHGIGRAVRIAVVAGLVSLVAFCAFLAAYGCSNNVTYKEDVLIVLGCAVNGKTPSETLVARLDKAVEYSQINPDVYIVVTGGQGPQEDIAEAQCMADYLIEKGVSEEKIIKEDTATSTNENYKYSKKILDEKFGTYTAAVITNEFHIFRAVQLAKLNGLEVTHMHAPTPATSAATMYLREILAVVKLAIFKS